MKIGIFFAFFALVSTKTSPESPLDKKSIQELYDCRPGETCAEKIKSTDNNFPEAIEQACPKCSAEQKRHMAEFVDAIGKGVPVEEAKKLHNPDNKYFDIVDNPDTAFSFDATVNAS